MSWTLPLSRWRRLGPERPRRKRPRLHPGIQHLERRWLFAANVTNGIVEYATTSTGSNPVGAVQGGDGNLWVTEYAADELIAYSPSGVIVKSVPLPGNPYGIAADASGNLWVTLDGSSPAVDEVSTGGTVLAQYALSSAALPQGITVAPNGTIWAAQYGANALAEIVPGSSAVTTFSLGKGTRPEDVVVGSDGNLWVTDTGTNQIERVGPTGVGLTTFVVPTSLSTPWWITPGPDGNLWFTESTAGKIGRITTTGVITEFALGSSTSAPKGIVTGPDGNLWFTESGTNLLGRISTADPVASLTTYTLPTPGSTPLGIAPGPNNAIWLTESGAGQVATLGWLPNTQVLTLDPDASPLLVGNENTSIALDPAPPCNCDQDTSSLLNSNLSLSYNSDTVDVRPIIQTTFQTPPNLAVTQIQVTLTWDGTPQATESFQTDSQGQGDEFLLSVQVANPVTATGSYPYEVNIQADLQNGSVVQGTTSGVAFVVVNGSSDPIGRGWSLGGSAQLYPDGQGGYFWISGSGGVRDFQAGGGSTFISPPNDLGTLVQTGTGTFTYTDPSQVKSYFTTVDGQVLLTSIVQPDGPTETFTYNASGAPVAVTVPGGWTATFNYGPNGGLAGISEPGNRALTITHDSSDDLITASLPDGSVHNYTYDSSGHMLSDTYGNQVTTYTYNPSTGTLADTNTGPGRTTGLVPASTQGLATSPVATASSQGMAVETDPMGRVTTYTYDALGLPTREQTPDGGVQTWQRDFSGQPTVYTDEMGRVTTYTYQYGSGDGELTQVTDPDGGTIRYQYNPTFHEVTQETDALGRVTTYMYNSQGDLTETIDPMRRTTTEVWSNGLLQSTTDPMGRTTTYIYNSQREETEQIDPMGRTTTYTYDAAGDQTSVEDPMGRITTSVYDAMRQVTESIDPMGRITTTLYDVDGEVTEVIDPMGRITTTLYDIEGEVTESIDPMGRITTTLYDADGEVTESIDPMGRITTSVYDAAGEVTESIDPMGRITTTLYERDGEVTESIDPMGRVTTTLYDADGGVTESVDPMGRITTTLYDLDVEVTESIDPLGHVTTTLYDADGEVTETIDAHGRTTTTLYNRDGEITESVDLMGRITTTRLYDADGEVTESIDPMGHATTTLYDADGEVTESIDPMGRITTTLYDADGEVTETIDPMGRITTTLYDADGEVTETIDPLGNRTTTQYDADGEVTETIDALGNRTTTLYDADGEVTGTVDPMGNMTTTLYDADGEVTESIDPLRYRTTTLYDADGEVTESIDPLGDRTTTLYDADGEATETIDPLGNRTTTLYDADGEVTETIDALGRSITTLYDADGRLVNQTWYDAGGNVVNTEAYTYDADGNMLTAGNDVGTYTMTYDALNREISVVDPFGLTMDYTYDADGDEIETQDSLGGVTTYLYDADNELTSERFGGTGQVPLRIDLTYDADGELLTETRYSNLAGTQLVVESSYTNNADGEITNLVDVNGGGTTVADFTYTYDRDNRVATENNMGLTTTYSYDADNELTSETSTLDTIDYSYDADGNRISGNSVIGPDNQLLSDNDWDYTYDADGNLIQKVGVASGPDNGITWSYTYDDKNEMTSAVETQGSTTQASITYEYDAFGDRIEESDSGSAIATQVTRFAYDGQNIWADLNGSNALLTRRLFLNTVDSVTARISASGTVAWYLADRLGSVNVIVDATGAVIDRITYDAFGDIIAETNPSASDRYLWTGREFNRVTGLQYNRARSYDPATGRWTTEDPIGFAGGDTNLYRYVENDPTNRTDPIGTVAFGLAIRAAYAAQIDIYIQDLSGDVADATLPKLIAIAERSPKLSLQLIMNALKTPKPIVVDKKKAQALIDDLNSPSFEVREKATKCLGNLGPGVLPLVRAALKAKPSPEQAYRLQQLIDSEELDADRMTAARNRRAGYLITGVLSKLYGSNNVPAGIKKDILDYLRMLSKAGAAKDASAIDEVNAGLANITLRNLGMAP